MKYVGSEKDDFESLKKASQKVEYCTGATFRTRTLLVQKFSTRNPTRTRSSITCTRPVTVNFIPLPYPYPTRIRQLHTRTQVWLRVPDPRVAVLYQKAL